VRIGKSVAERRHWGSALSLRLLVDAGTQHRELVLLLREAGHDVLTANDAGLRKHEDDAIFAQAQFEERRILTRNANDFEALHSAFPNHYGIIVIYPAPTRKKSMTTRDILQAIANLDASGWEISGHLIALNSWQF
jgi:predicted nuclease of predicted toxin-antitoxin system